MRKALQLGAVLVALVLISLWSIIPPAEKLRRGKDLAGGVSLVYAVNIEGDENPAEVLSRTIEVLKQRVDPNGQFDITMIAQGDNRIEVSMPLATENVVALRRQINEKLEALAQVSINEGELERAMRASESERPALLSEIAAGSEVRLEMLRSVALAYDAARSARQAFTEAREAGASEEILDSLVEQAAAAELAYDRARDEALTSAVSADEVRRALELPSQERMILDRATGETVTIASPRQRALERLRAQHPDLAAELDEIVALYTQYEDQRRGYDDPADLMRVLQGAGILTFRIAVEPGELPDEQDLRNQLRERGPRNVQSNEARWYQIDDLESWYDDAQTLRSLQDDPINYFASRYSLVVEERDGLYYALLYDRPGLRLTQAEGVWRVDGAFQTVDQLGRPAIGFTMNPAGAVRMGNLTGDNVGRQMAVILDDRVYTAPNLNSRIEGSGIIQGRFTDRDIQYIIRTLAAGSLSAKLGEEPISTSVIAPQLGADNLHKGLVAGIYALVVVSGFMIVYYMTSGGIAVIALACNAILLLGAMSLSRAAFTMPGIAGVILTFGMAVDANVIIFERIREEIMAGQKVKAAVRIGYNKALSAIIDGNITNLIVCLVLGSVGTPEIRGFAITLGIGVVTTLISALLITRVLYTLLLEGGVMKTVPMLPSVFPAVHRLLEPRIDWLGKRFLFYAVSATLLAASFGVIAYQGKEMFDNEFRGGTAVTVELASGQTLTRQQVEERLRAEASKAPPGSEQNALISAQVVALNPQADNVTSDTFKIKTVVTNREVVEATVLGAFTDVLDARPPVVAESVRPRPVLQSALGENIDRPDIRDDAGEYVGGVAVVAERLQPPIALDDLQARLSATRSRSDHSDSLGRSHRVVILEGDANAITSFALLAYDQGASYFDDQGRWQIELAQSEVAVVTEALERASSLAGVESFSPAIARTFAAQAIVAVGLSILGILIYVWIRFGTVRYSLAAVLPGVHDTIIMIGLVAGAEMLYKYAPGVAATFLIEPFKIDLAMVAAVLTIIGYSLNDTIVTMDRIRENKGRLPYATREIINLSVNQTFSRTLITSGTTLIAALALYLFGGQGTRGFAYAIFCGVLVGTYSSIAIATPIVWQKKVPAPKPVPGRPAAASSSEAALASASTT
jgi:SecD/SecF fusion protein